MVSSHDDGAITGRTWVWGALELLLLAARVHGQNEKESLQVVLDSRA